MENPTIEDHVNLFDDFYDRLHGFDNHTRVIAAAALVVAEAIYASIDVQKRNRNE